MCFLWQVKTSAVRRAWMYYKNYMLDSKMTPLQQIGGEADWLRLGKGQQQGPSHWTPKQGVVQVNVISYTCDWQTKCLKKQIDYDVMPIGSIDVTSLFLFKYFFFCPTELSPCASVSLTTDCLFLTFFCWGRLRRGTCEWLWQGHETTSSKRNIGGPLIWARVC